MFRPDCEYERNWRFGRRQKEIIAYLRSRGGCANTYSIQRACSRYVSGYASAERALWRLHDRGAVRVVYRGGGLDYLSERQREVVERAMAENSRASTFWVLADWLLPRQCD